MSIQVFISHIHEEARLALELEQQLSTMLLGGVRFFVSSDRKSIRAGDRWLERIRDALTESPIILVLVGPHSMHRNWINFEAGAGWLKKRVIPLCHSGLGVSQLLEPLRSLNALDLHDPNDLRELTMTVAQAAGLNAPEENWGRLVEALRRSCDDVSYHVQPVGTINAYVFPASEDSRTLDTIRKSLRTCKEVKLCAMGLNFLWNANSLDILTERALNLEMRVQICMANYTSEAIIARLSEEPEHPIGVAGSEHIIRRFVRLEKQIGDRTKFAINIFKGPFPYAVLLFDDEVYLYLYGHKVLGNSSPTFYWCGKDPATRFFNTQFDTIMNASDPASCIYG